MLEGVHGWKRKTFTLITQLRSEFLHTRRMEKSPNSAWRTPSNVGSNTSSSIGDVAPRAGAGRGVAVSTSAKSTSKSGLPANTSASTPAKKGSFGGALSSKSHYPAATFGAQGVQFGSYDPSAQEKQSSFGSVATSRSCLPAASNEPSPSQLGPSERLAVPSHRSGASETSALPERVDPLQVSNVQPVAVANDKMALVDKVDHRTDQRRQKLGSAAVQPPATKNVVEEYTVLQPPKASPTALWAQDRTAKEAVRNKSNDAIPSSYDEDFPALGAPSSAKTRMPQRQAWKPEAPEPSKPEAVSTSNPRVDMSARVAEPPKVDARREVGSSGAAVMGPERDEQNKFKRGRGGVDSDLVGGRDPVYSRVGGDNYHGGVRTDPADVWRGGDNYRGRERRDPIDSLGRTLTKILRHQALELKIILRNDGYAEVRELLKLPMKTGSGRPMSSHTVEDVRQAVMGDNKQRFGIKEENGVLLIRANQGHTIKTVETEKLLQPILTAEEIPVCVHGTYRKFLASIAQEGLKRMSRNHVHFASGLSATDGAISGMRKTSEILIYLDVCKALEDGMKLYMSENGVILTEGFDGVVPPKYFKEIRTWPENKPVKW